MKNFARIILIILLVQLIYSVGFSQNRQIRGDSISLRYGGYFGGVVEIDGITYHNYYQVKEVATATDDHDAVPLFQIIDSINAGTSGSTYWQQSGDSLFLKNSSNYVGIGTNTPLAKLDVRGRISLNDGGGSVFVGEVAGINSTGYNNTGIGHAALLANTIGYNNTGIGNGSLQKNITGNMNIAAGYNAGKFIVGGAGNNTSGDENTFLGSRTKASVSGSTNETALGANTEAQGDSTVTLGHDVHTVYISDDGTGDLKVGGIYDDSDTKGTTGQKLTSTGTGLSWVDDESATFWDKTGNYVYPATITDSIGIGTNTPKAILDVAGRISISNTGQSVFIGEGAGENDNLSDNLNVAIGYQSMYYNTTGTHNSAMGYQALYSNTTGYYNSAMGAAALLNNTTGTHNSAMGYQALYSNTTGTHNSAMGYQALHDNTTGTYNSAMGASALRYNTTGGNNSAMGNQALYFNTTGNQNSAIGMYALLNNTTGCNNSAMGASALRYNTTGGNNSAMGNQALHYNTTGCNNSAMGTYTLRDLNILDITGGNTAVGYNTGRGIVTGVNNSIFGANVTGLDAALSNNIILANGTGAIKAQHDGTDWTLTGRVKTTDFTMTNGAANGYMLQSDAFGDASWVATDAYSQDLGFTASAGTVTISDGTDVTIGGFSTTDSDYGLVPGTDRGNTYYINGAGSWSVPGGTIKRIAKSLTSSEVNGLGTEFDIINAPGTGKYILIHDATCKVTVTTQLEIGTQELSIIYADVSATNAIYRFTNSSIESSSTSRWPKAQPTSLIEIEENKAVAVRLAGSTDPVSGSVTMDFTVLYTIEDY